MINVLKRLAELDAMNPNIQNEGSKHASRPGTEKRPGSADQAQKTLDRKKEVKAAAEKRRNEKDVEEGLGYRGVGGAKHYDDDEGWGSGWKKPQSREQYCVHINGKKWKTFSDKAEADRVAAAVGKKYPDKRVLVMPSTVRESAVNECGMMGSGMPGQNHTPASINMSADSGEELTGMLRDIMQLAGLSKQGPEDSSADVTVLSPTPTLGVASSSDGDDMRSIIDKLNPAGDDGSSDGFDDDEDDEETDESYDNTPEDPTNPSPYDSEEYAHHENPPGAAAGRGFTSNPRAVPEDIEAKLFADYQEFINEGSKPDFLDADKDGDKKEPMKQALKQKKMKK